MAPQSYNRRVKSRNYKDKVLVIADGLPSVPSKFTTLDYFSKKGYWVFYPRYRGTWESGGKLFADSPTLDIQAVIEGVGGRFRDHWTRDSFKLNVRFIGLIGVSFGGTAALLLSGEKRIHACVSISPVIDWRLRSRGEPLNKLKKFLAQSFGPSYRISSSGWKKLVRGSMFNPSNTERKLDGSKILIFHGTRDNVAPYAPVKKFARHINADLVTLRGKGHLGSGMLRTQRNGKRIVKFLLDMYTEN